MRSVVFWGLLLLLIGLWAFSDALFPPEIVTSPKALVRDGDTLILGEQTIRLHGMDAPEYAQTCKDATGKDWPCGKAARAQLSALVLPGSIVCEPKAQDKYNRKVAKCASATVADLSESMVQAGLAISPSERGTAPYAEAEASAKSAKRGIWQGVFETPETYRDRAATRGD